MSMTATTFTRFASRFVRREAVILTIASAAAVALCLSRLSISIWDAEFWAEDGTVFFAEAFRHGPLAVLFSAYGGYFCIAQRFIAAILLLVPLEYAPTTSLLLSVAVQVLPVPLILSTRFATLIPDWRARLLLAVFYLAAPNAYELHGSLTNIQWFLALFCFCLIVAAPPRTRILQGIEATIVVIAGLSGPFSVFLAPIALFLAWQKRSKWLLVLAVILALTAAIQAGLLLFFPVPHLRAPAKDPSWLGGIKIFAGQVGLNALAGSAAYSKAASLEWYQAWGFVLPAMLAFGSLLHALRRGPNEVRLFILFAALIMGSALAYSTAPWGLFLTPYAAGRYWLVPCLAVLACWISMLRSPARCIRIGAAVCLCLACIGVCFDWKFPPRQAGRFLRQLPKYYAAAPGEEVRIAIRPRGWGMLLVRKEGQNSSRR